MLAEHFEGHNGGADGGAGSCGAEDAVLNLRLVVVVGEAAFEACEGVAVGVLAFLFAEHEHEVVATFEVEVVAVLIYGVHVRVDDHVGVAVKVAEGGEAVEQVGRVGLEACHAACFAVLIGDGLDGGSFPNFERRGVFGRSVGGIGAVGGVVDFSTFGSAGDFSVERPFAFNERDHGSFNGSSYG